MVWDRAEIKRQRKLRNRVAKSTLTPAEIIQLIEMAESASSNAVKNGILNLKLTHNPPLNDMLAGLHECTQEQVKNMLRAR